MLSKGGISTSVFFPPLGFLTRSAESAASLCLAFGLADLAASASPVLAAVFPLWRLAGGFSSGFSLPSGPSVAVSRFFRPLVFPTTSPCSAKTAICGLSRIFFISSPKWAPLEPYLYPWDKHLTSSNPSSKCNGTWTCLDILCLILSVTKQPWCSQVAWWPLSSAGNLSMTVGFEGAGAAGWTSRLRDADLLSTNHLRNTGIPWFFIICILHTQRDLLIWDHIGSS